MAAFNSHTWQEIILGRIAVLRLSGFVGSRDLWNAHLPASEEVGRLDAIRTIAKHLRKQNKTLSLVVGDWNFTEHVHDRFIKASGEWSCDRQKEEAQLLNTVLVNKQCMKYC